MDPRCCRRACLRLGVMALVALSVGCGGHTQRNLIYETTVPLPAGRFVGPVEVEVPRQANHHGRDFEIHAELEATCGPLLHISYPDGEVYRIGDRDKRWQALLARRAENPDPADDAPVDRDAPVELDSPAASEPPADTDTDADAEPVATSAAPGTVAPAPPERGRWQRVTTETWPGQLEFLRWRDARCSSAGRYRRSYVTGYDETGRVTVWAEVPQELGEGRLTIRVYELVDAEAEAEARERAAAKERKRIEAERRRQRQEAEAAARPPKPRPPQPPPKKENPAAAEAEGATWSPGYWAYSEGRGKWVWISGYWNPPARTPGARAENHGPPPVAGCTWQSGYWVWVQGPGRWDWVPGHWNPPPPKVEERGQPPVPESEWITGRWVADGKSFTWIAGYWGRPRPRAETIPPPPFEGATWRPGTWLKVKGQWVWSAGFYENTRRAPPPRRNESPGARPHADAVWLAGFWRWNQQRNDYDWIAGHWELPPGEGYVWIPDPPDPQTGHSTGGRWRLRIDLDVDVKIKPGARR